MKNSGREAVARPLYGRAPVDVSGGGCGMDGTAQLPRDEQVDRIEPGKQPAACEDPSVPMGHALPDTQAFEQSERAPRVDLVASCVGGTHVTAIL